MQVDKKLLKIHVCGKKIDLDKIKDIFPDFCDQKYKENVLIGDYQWKTEQFNWIAKLYINNKFSSIAEEIKSDSDLEQDKDGINKHVILSFGDENNEELFEEIQNIGLVFLPRIIFVTKKAGNYNFKKKAYISNIIYPCLNDNQIVSYIKDEIWEIDCYYNERGNETSKYLVSNVMNNIEISISNTSINLLLCGVSRAGKSSFINVINNSLLALENCGKSSLTSKITEYQIYDKRNRCENQNKGFIKIIDTPGFSYSTDKKTEKNELTNIDEINNGIEKLIKEYKNKSSFEDIHFILFFFLEGTSLEGAQKVLEMFQDGNYNVLFIINRSLDDSDKGESADIRALQNFLKKNGLGKLNIRENIICCNIIKTKLNGYGIDTIFNRICNILRKNNPFFGDNELLNNLKNNVKILNDLMDIKGKEQEFDKYLKENFDLKKKIAKENDLFKTFRSEDSLVEIETSKQSCEKIISSFEFLTISNAIIPIPYSDLALTPTLQAIMIVTILTNFGIPISDINIPFFADMLKEGVGRHLGHATLNYSSKQIFASTAKGCATECIKELAKLLAAKQGGKAISESVKFIPFLGFIIGGGIGAVLNYYTTSELGRNAIHFCENYLKKKGSLELIILKIESFKNIFDYVKELSTKENWWENNVKIIQKKEQEN